MDLKIKDVAELLNVSETTIRRWLTEGKIPAYRIHHQYRFSRMEIENWVMSCKLKSSKGNFLPLEEEQIYPIKSEKEQPEPKQELTAGQQQFSLFRAINRGDVVDSVTSSEKGDIIRDSVEFVADDLNVDGNVLTELLLDREKLMPTALNNGIAIPHTREFLIDQPFDYVMVVYPKDPVDWGALDGNLVHTLMFLFASDDKRHLHLLAKIAHLTSDEKNLEFLKTKPRKDELLAFIKSWESKIKQKY